MGFVYDGAVFVYSYRDSSRVFLFLRNPRGWLDIPKGHVEKGENTFEAAIRETKEETGLDVKPDRFFRYVFGYWVTDDKQKKKKMVIAYLANVPTDAKVVISSEHAGYEWLTFEQAMRRFKFKDQPKYLNAVNDYINRLEEMEKLNAEYSQLPKRFRGWSLSDKLVRGEGPLNAKVMLVGQAPGRHEDEQGRPFVGISGRLLDRLVRTAGLRREQVYITSVVQFFPPENRVPSDKEISACRSFLMRQIKIVDPKIVVVVGAVSANELLGMKGIMKIRGKLIKRDRNYFITLHPAAAVRIKKNLPLIEDDFRRLKSALSGL